MCNCSIAYSALPLSCLVFPSPFSFYLFFFLKINHLHRDFWLGIHFCGVLLQTSNYTGEVRKCFSVLAFSVDQSVSQILNACLFKQTPMQNVLLSPEGFLLPMALFYWWGTEQQKAKCSVQGHSLPRKQKATWTRILIVSIPRFMLYIRKFS